MKKKLFFQLWDFFLIVAAPLLIHFHLLLPLGAIPSFTRVQFWLFLIAIFFIAIAGKLIIYLESLKDLNPNPQKNQAKLWSEKIGYRLFFIFTIIGVSLGFYLSNMVGKPNLVSLFIAVSAGTYFYANVIRGYLVIGNLLISALVALLILGTGIFELLPMLTPMNRPIQTATFLILLRYAGIAFLLTWLRSLITDQLTIDRDYNKGWNSLSLVFGRARTNIFIFGLNVLLLFVVIYTIVNYLYSYTWIAIYALLLILTPLLWIMVKSWAAKSSKDYRKMLFVFQMVQTFVVLSVIFFDLLLKFT